MCCHLCADPSQKPLVFCQVVKLRSVPGHSTPTNSWPWRNEENPEHSCQNKCYLAVVWQFTEKPRLLLSLTVHTSGSGGGRRTEEQLQTGSIHTSRVTPVRWCKAVRGKAHLSLCCPAWGQDHSPDPAQTTTATLPVVLPQTLVPEGQHPALLLSAYGHMMHGWPLPAVFDQCKLWGGGTVRSALVELAHSKKPVCCTQSNLRKGEVGGNTKTPRYLAASSKKAVKGDIPFASFMTAKPCLIHRGLQANFSSAQE